MSNLNIRLSVFGAFAGVTWHKPLKLITSFLSIPFQELSFQPFSPHIQRMNGREKKSTWVYFIIFYNCKTPKSMNFIILPPAPLSFDMLIYSPSPIFFFFFPPADGRIRRKSAQSNQNVKWLEEETRPCNNDRHDVFPFLFRTAWRRGTRGDRRKWEREKKKRLTWREKIRCEENDCMWRRIWAWK